MNYAKKKREIYFYTVIFTKYIKNYSKTNFLNTQNYGFGQLIEINNL